MRGLNQRQKAILREWIKTNKDKITINFTCVNNLPDDVYWQVHDLNDFETLNQEIERFVVDEVFEN